MTRLYGHKWVSKEGDFPIDDQGRIDKGHPNIYGFRVWFDAVKHLTDEQWKRGVDRVQSNIREAAKIGDESWPPSFEEFVTYATENRNSAHKYFMRGLPEPKEVKEARKERGREECKKLLSIFDD